MSVYDLSYRRYEGTRRSRVSRVLAILATGVRLGLRRRFLVMAMLLAAPFAFLFGVLFYFASGGLEEFLQRGTLFYLRQEWVQLLGKDTTRAGLWALLVERHFHFSMLWVLLVIPWIGPTLLADDLESRALTIYFSKPIHRVDYLVGKWAVLGFFVACVTLVPSVVLYVASILMCRDLTVLWGTWRLVPAAGALWLVVSGVGGLLMLAFSASGLGRRFAAAGWLMVVLGSEVVRQVLLESPHLLRPKWLGMLSLPANVEKIGRALFGVWETGGIPLWGAAGVLTGVALCSVLYVWWRVRTVEESR